MQSYDYVKLECQIQKKYLFIDFSLIVYTYNFNLKVQSQNFREKKKKTFNNKHKRFLHSIIIFYKSRVLKQMCRIKQIYFLL